MGDPDIVNAFLGATVGSGVIGPVWNKLMEGLQYVYHCKAEWAALRVELEEVKPMLEKISDRHKSDTTLSNWLTALEKCVARASEILDVCKGDGSKVWNRVLEVQYGVKILELKEKIHSDVNLAGMALLSLHSGSSKGSCGIVQEVPRKILGMEDHLEKVKLLVLEGHKKEDSSCVVIRGMGGAGKTLLAQMVNNDEDIRGAFGDACVIWITCGRNADLSVLYDRMRNCLQVCSDGGSEEDQRTELVNAFSKRSVLLILDDVWDGIVHKCVEMVDWLNVATGPGSVTLLTTRDESITRKCVAVGEEVILRLSEEQSRELFCTHAFGTETPMLDTDMKGVVMDVCNECKCLPLALKVLGRAMKGRRGIREWRLVLRRLRASSRVDKSVEEQLFGRLQFSYDELNETHKICFLYFAAFPEDYEIKVKDMCEIWVAEGLFGEGLDMVDAWDEADGAINELFGRSLIEVGQDGSTVKMHDILRDLAIRIANEGDECDRESLFQVDMKKVGDFPRAWLGSTMKVKRLSLWGNTMKGFPGTFKAPDLKMFMVHPRGTMHYNKCELEEFFKYTQALRYIHFVSDDHMKVLPESVGKLGSLQHLDLSGCDALEQLPESIGELGSLQHLNLSHCDALERLPESMGELGSLQHLDLSLCSALKQLPESMGGLRSLQYLNVSWCRALEQLPESMGELGSLQHLYLSRCLALEQLPKSMGELGSLQHLNLSLCYALKQLPESMGGLGSLQHLNLSDCYALERLPESMGVLGSLQLLNVSHCDALEQLPESMGELGSLLHLDLTLCDALKQLPESMGELGSLQHLNLSWCRALKRLPESMGELGSLQHLNLSSCYALERLPESMRVLGSLQFLNVSHCYALEQLPESMGELGSLLHLDLSCCTALKQLPESMGELGSLQHLNLSWCRALKRLPESMGELGSLQHLNLSSCYALERLPESMRVLGSLQLLNVSHCYALEQLPESMGELGSLQHLDLSCCTALKQLPKSMGELGSLQHLDLSRCRALEQLPESMGELGSLQHLNLSRCWALEQLPKSMGELGSLQHLNLSLCYALKQLPESMGGLGSLQHLNLSECSALERLPESIGELRSLQHLNLSKCSALEQLPESMGRLRSLQHLDLSDCKRTIWVPNLTMDNLKILT